MNKSFWLILCLDRRLVDFRRAILENQDVVGSAGLSDLLGHDFWGVPLSHTGSHKSYRPLTTLTFRLNWTATGHSPWPFHATNVLLHSLATWLFVRLCSRWAGQRASGLAGLLFAVHPVHTEAVAGVVGRADLLAGVLFLAALLAHQDPRRGAAVPLLAGAAMLAKEQGVTVLGVCMVQELLERRAWKAKKGRLLKLALSCVALLSLRFAALGGGAPTFARADNPAAHAPGRLSRLLTFLFLPAFNFRLLLCPSTLSYDWSMNSIPLVESLLDARNLATLAFYSGLGCVVLAAVKRHHSCLVPTLGRAGLQKAQPSSPPGLAGADPVVMSTSLLVLPFLPATNLFFYVGFVVAERLMYVPSLGFCLLVGTAADRMLGGLAKHRGLIRMCLAILFVAGAARTFLRNKDWRDEETLFK